MTNGPKYDIVAVRKDGQEQTFTDYSGNEKTSKFRKVGAIWDRDGKLSMSLESAITDEDREECWLNLFAREAKEKQGSKKPAAKAPAKKPVATKPKATVKPAQEPFDGDEDEDLDS